MTHARPLDVESLRSAFTGPVTTPDDDGWDLARQAWNLAVDQHPVAVAEAIDVKDVQAAVRLATTHGLRVAVQGTGHGAAPLGPLDDTLLLKTARMRGFELDAAARTARVEAGVLWGELAIAAGEQGLAGLAGSSVDVGVVGYTLGGGVGWLARKHGLAANSVRALELVTADGELRRVDADHEPELFWALRGGGGSFGAVTALEFELYDLPEVYAGSAFWPAELGAEVMHAYREWAANTPDELTSIIRFLHLPPLPEVPEPLRDRPLVDLGVAYIGDAAAGEELMRPLREIGPMVMEQFGTVPTAELRSLHGDPEQPVPGLGDHTLLRELPSEAVDALTSIAGHESGSPLLGVELRQLGGALARSDPDHGALDSLDADYVLYGVGIPMTPELGEAVRARLGLVAETMAPWATGGAYLNFDDKPGGDTAAAFPAETYTRLQAVKAHYDPEDLFRSNHPVALK